MVYYCYMSISVSDKVLLESIRTMAEAANSFLRILVEQAATILPEDLASDYVYEVLDLDQVVAELEK